MQVLRLAKDEKVKNVINEGQNDGTKKMKGIRADGPKFAI